MTGWRIGFTAGPSSIIEAMNKVQGQSTSNPTSISQKASQEALNSPQDLVQAMVGEFLKRRNYVIDRLNSLAGVSCIKPVGAFYAFPNFSSYLGKSFGGKPVGEGSPSPPPWRISRLAWIELNRRSGNWLERKRTRPHSSPPVSNLFLKVVL
jgi:hypothetical protein